jgi:predicted signal transduction protein with EAL and GGDEF domain
VDACGSLLHQLEGDGDENSEIVRTSITLGYNHLGIEVVAEGVEIENQSSRGAGAYRMVTSSVKAVSVTWSSGKTMIS